MSNKKAELLGMNPGTASHRLVKDLLFDFVMKAEHKCHRCGEELTRETFSIEHMEAWQSAEVPIEAFFDLENIAYSHMKCNSAASTKPGPVCGTAHMYLKYGCRCEECKAAKSKEAAKYYKKEDRHKRYKRTGH